jgi:hypothetical protein
MRAHSLFGGYYVEFHTPNEKFSPQKEATYSIYRMQGISILYVETV